MWTVSFCTRHVNHLLTYLPTTWSIRHCTVYYRRTCPKIVNSPPTPAVTRYDHLIPIYVFRTSLSQKFWWQMFLRCRPYIMEQSTSISSVIWYRTHYVQMTLENLFVLLRPVRICDILFNLRIVQMFLLTYLLTYINISIYVHRVHYECYFYFFAFVWSIVYTAFVRQTIQSVKLGDQHCPLLLSLP